MTFNKIFQALRGHVIRCAKEGTLTTKYNIATVAIIGGLGHTIFYFLHHRLFGQDWESFPLSMLAGLLALSVTTKNKWPENIAPFFPVYWHMVLIYELPFLVTLFAMGNGFQDIWPTWFVAMIFFLIVLVPNYLMFFLDMIIGIAFVFVYHLIYPSFGYIDNDHINFTWYFCVVSFAIVAGSISGYSNIKGSRHKEKGKLMKSLAGSIAHELRNPLNSIKLSVENLSDQVNNKTTTDLEQLKKEEIIAILHSEKSEIIKHKKLLDQTVKLANEIIDMTLLDLSGKLLSEEDFVYMDSKSAITNAMNIYGYKNEREKEKVIFKNLDKDFQFRAAPTPFKYILFNLVKNALFYLKEYPDSTITIGSQPNKSFEINGEKMRYNAIYVHDTGPGIPEDILGKIFGSFYTSGKKGGTGLGLDFCKRTMISFGGNIIVESKHNPKKQNSWTKFTLLFPMLSKEEKAKYKTIGDSEILIIDDHIENLNRTRTQIEDDLPGIYCATITDGQKAIELLQEKEYKMVLIEVQMANMEGIMSAKRIRECNKDIPIIAFTSLNHREFVSETKKALKGGSISDHFDFYLNKSSPPNILYRSITKLLFKREDELLYLGEQKDYLKHLKKKNILLADDQAVNLMMTKKRLERYGMKVTTVTDGKDLVETYQKSIKLKKRSKYDMIITDIHMPTFNGDEATEEIRKIEKDAQILHRNKIPIIALSGDGNKEDIHHFLECRMTDYFIKGEDPEILTKIVANYLISVKDNEYGSDFNRAAKKRRLVRAVKKK